jgi:hypothetical protein
MISVSSLLLTILGLGYGAVGLVGFLGWRARLRSGVGRATDCASVERPKLHSEWRRS